MNEKSLSYLIALLLVIAIGIWGALVLNQMSVDPAHAPFCAGDPNTEWGSCLLAGAAIVLLLLPACGHSCSHATSRPGAITNVATTVVIALSSCATRLLGDTLSSPYYCLAWSRCNGRPAAKRPGSNRSIG